MLKHTESALWATPSEERPRGQRAARRQLKPHLAPTNRHRLMPSRLPPRSVAAFGRRAAQPLRHRLGTRAHRLIDRVVRARLEQEREGWTADETVGTATDAQIEDRTARAVDAAAVEARRAALEDHRLFGPADRLSVAEDAIVNDVLFNTVSGRIVVEPAAFFGHDVAILTGTCDVRATGLARHQAVPTDGHDITIEAGAWIGSRATVLGPCRIGAHAVVAAGALVREDVAPGSIVAGVPARPIGSIVVPPDLPTVDVLTDVGRMFAHTHDEFITPCLVEHGAMQDDDLGLLRTMSLPGATVVDVGANIGYSTLALSAAVGPAGTIVAFEPHPDNVTLLRANLARNGVENVEVVPHAAMASEQTVVLSEATMNTGDHRIWNGDGDDPGTTIVTDGEQRRTLRVDGVQIDAHVGEELDVRFMIVDTQGSEHHALRGAQATIERCRPTIFVEFWPYGIRDRSDDPVDVLGVYRALGYDRRVLEDPTLDGLDDAECAARVDARPGPGGGFVTLVLEPAA